MGCGLSARTKAFILAVLDSLQEDNAFCHGDFRPENILLTAEEPVIIDWVDAPQGCPLVDIARTTLLLRVDELLPSTSQRRRQKIAKMPHLFYEAIWKRSTKYGAFASVISVVVLWIYFFIQGWEAPGYTVGGTGIMPVAVILAVSVVAMIIGSLLSKPPDSSIIQKFFLTGVEQTES